MKTVGMRTKITAYNLRGNVVRLQNFTRRLSDRFSQLAGPNDGGIAAPTQNPTLDLSQARELHPQLDALSQSPQLLRIVPFLFPDIIGGTFVEPKHDLVFTATRMNSTTV